MGKNKNDIKSASGTPKVVLIFTPLLIMMVCAAIIVIAGIKPYNKVSSYLNIVFSDNMKMTSTASQDLIIGKADLTKFDDVEKKNETDEGKVIYPKFGEQYAVVECEAVQMNVPVYWGSNSELLKNGACQLSGSVAVGDVGNAVIDAHVNTFFENLDKIKEGDAVVVKTSYGMFTYKVKETVEFVKKNKKFISPSKTEKLTLYTCKKQVLGATDQRVAVICEPVEKVFYSNEV